MALKAIERMCGDCQTSGGNPLVGLQCASEAARDALDENREHLIPPEPARSTAPLSETGAIRYERRPELDKRIARGDDFAGDAWVRWTAVGHSPNGNSGELSEREQRRIDDAVDGDCA